MASTYLQRTPSSNGNRRTWTFSAWVKISSLSANTIFDVGTNGGNNYTPFFFQSDGKIRLYEVVNGTLQNYNLITNRVFRDTSAWYHLVYRLDTTQSTASDRIRLYVNGVQETSFSTATYPAQNYDTLKNSTSYENVIGIASDNRLNAFDGSMSHIHFCDGYSYDPTAFGETDATTGEWKIKTSPSVTYGTNGFFILKDGNSVTDQSGNSNNFTVAGGTLTKTEDNPSNVFAVVNSLSTGDGAEFAYGNTRVRKDTSGFLSSLGTIACGLGKYYWEVFRHGGGNLNVGICLAEKDGTTQSAVDAGRVIYTGDGYIIETGIGGGQSNLGITFGDTDIIGIALDTENGILKFYKNGTLVKTITSTSLLYSNNEFVPAWQLANGGEARNNFGNGYFGTTAVSSAGTNASNNGIFEYDVPAGFTALSTKGLNL